MSTTPAPNASSSPANGRIRLVDHPGTVEVRHGDTLVASSSRVIELHEGRAPVRLYIPRDDVNLDTLRPIAESTTCPFKGEASDYWALADDASGAPVAWSYPAPIDTVAPIAGHVAFYDTVSVRTID